jgi:hypothetical protein
MTKLIYIGGYGHSGSTLLEYLLAACPEIVACGEVASVPRERGRKEKCTCGRMVEECPLWGPLHVPSGSFGESHEQLALALRERVKGRYAAVVDSSKTPWRYMAAPFRLREALGSDFVLQHLVRDPRGASWSAVKKAGRQGKPPLSLLRSSIAALGWLVANLACEAFASWYPQAYRRLRYEDLVRAPDKVMPKSITALLPGADWHAGDVGSSRDNRHQLYGNRLRGKTLTLTDIQEDIDWQRDMPKIHRLIVGAITYPLRKRYGY